MRDLQEKSSTNSVKAQENWIGLCCGYRFVMEEILLPSADDVHGDVREPEDAQGLPGAVERAEHGRAGAAGDHQRQSDGRQVLRSLPAPRRRRRPGRSRPLRRHRPQRPTTPAQPHSWSDRLELASMVAIRLARIDPCWVELKEGVSIENKKDVDRC